MTNKVIVAIPIIVSTIATTAIVKIVRATMEMAERRNVAITVGIMP